MKRKFSRRTLASVLVAALATQGSLPAALAQPKATIAEELPTPELKEEWKRALELVDNKDWAKALDRFKRVFAATSNPRVLYNMGVCEKQLKRYARALAVWEQALAAGPNKLSASEEQNIKNGLAGIRPFVTTLKVTANEAGATLTINGDEVGVTPLPGPIPVEVAHLKVSLKKEGFYEKAIEIDTETGKPASVDFQLEPLGRTSIVTVDVSGAASATVQIDGVDMGAAPFKGKLPPGRHTIEARAAGYETARKTVEVVAGEPVNLALALSKTRNDGKLKVVVPGHADAVVEVDGRTVGRGAYSGVLAIGGHQLLVRKSGYVTVQQDVAIARDQVRSLEIKLVRDRGSAWIFGTVGGVLLLTGAVVTTVFLVSGADRTPVSGTLTNGVTPAGFRFR